MTAHPSETTAALRRAIDERLAARDRTGAVQAATVAVREGGIAIDALYADVLAPLLVDTGAAWQAGTTSVWEEHYATATVRTIVESLYLDVATASRELPSRGVAVLACPPGEVHDLGLRMLADRMRLRGWRAEFVGADTPLRELIDASHAFSADAVVLSVATHYNRIQLRSYTDGLADALPGVRIHVGGPAFAADKLEDDLLGEMAPRAEQSAAAEDAHQGGDA